MYIQNELFFSEENNPALEVIKRIDDQSRMRLFQQKTHLFEKTKYPELYSMRHKEVVELLYEYHDLKAREYKVNPERVRKEFISMNSSIDVYYYSKKEKSELAERSRSLGLVY